MESNVHSLKDKISVFVPIQWTSISMRQCHIGTDIGMEIGTDIGMDIRFDIGVSIDISFRNTCNVLTPGLASVLY